MCLKLKDLAGKDALSILKDTSVSTIPVDLDLVLEKLGVIKVPSSFEDLEDTMGKKRGSISGLVLFNEKDVGIYYKKDDTIAQKRFTIAHELGHCCLHGNKLQDNHIEMLCKEQVIDENDTEEIEANLFARQLLIPEQWLKDIHSKLILPSLYKLSEIFEVPQELMLRRLIELKMTYYDDERDKLIPPCL